MKPRPKSRGLLNYLSLNLMSENQASSGCSRSQHPNRDSEPESVDSPYKDSMSEIKQITLNNDGADDFRTPKPIKKVAKEKSKCVVVPKKNIKRTRRKLTSSIEKHTKDNFQNLDVNPDHLQMALALSKSTFAEEYPEEYKKTEEQDFAVFLSPEKIPKVTTILEKYGFRASNTNKPKLHPELSTNPSELQDLKKRKYSKFRFITPTLHTRTDEERESLITAKISLIVAQKRQLPLDYSSTWPVILNSETLQKYHCHESHIININMIAMEELKGFCYYCASVKVPPSQSSYGCLLKNWEEIPGREKSPERGSSVLESKDSMRDVSPKLISQDLSDDNIAGERHKSCPSPDLFDSDNESFSLRSESTERLSSTSWTISPSKGSGSLSGNAQTEGIFSKKLSMISSSNNGIEYFESFNTDSENISEEVFSLKRGDSDSQEGPEDEFVDLTQSSSSNEGCCLENIHGKTSTEEVVDDSSQHAYKNSLKTLPSALTNANEKSQDVILEMDEFLNLSQKSLRFNTSENSAEMDTENSQVQRLEVDEFLNLTQQSPQSRSSKNSSLINTQKNPEEDGRLEVEEFLKLTQKSLRCETSKNSLLMNDPEDERLEMENCLNLTQKSPQCIETEFSFENDQSDSIMEDNSVKQNRNANQINEICADTSVAPIIWLKLKNLTESTDKKKSLDADDTILNEYFAKSLEENDKISDTSRNRLSFTSDRHSSEYNSSKSLNVTDYVTEMLNSQPDQISENNSDKLSQMSCSQETIVISDEELNYSSIHSMKQKNDFYNLSDFDEIGSDKNEDIMNVQELENKHSDLRNKYGSQSSQQSLDEVELSQHLQTEELVENQVRDYDTPQKLGKATEPVLHRAGINNTQISGSKDVVTPDNNLLIKTTDVTPMTNYDQMDTPSIRKELDKFGFKPLKRPRAIKLLKYIYETTHPLVTSKDLSSPEPEENERAFKRRKSFHLEEDLLSVDSLIFERKISSKVSSCRIPLQIAWDNFVSDNPQLQENILLYEPIQLEVVHSMLKEQSGCKFHIEDMINFLDKKCITFRTSQSQSARTKKII